MSTLGKSWTSAKVVCPRAEHADSRVRLERRYGKPGHRRQMYRCVPANGDKQHRFIGVLPREEPWTATCELCERPVHPQDGPHAARHYQFVVRGIAGALRAVGAGMSYRGVALVARERARRLREDPMTGELHSSRHGSLVMDWVEVFAPVVFEPHRPSDWPAAGSLLLDDLPFRVRDRQTGHSKVAFRVFCAMGYEDGQKKLWRTQAFTDKSRASWETFLRGLGGAPGRIVCDNDGGLTAAVRAVFPQAEIYLCEWHLKHAFERLLDKVHRDEPQHRASVVALRPRVEAAFTGQSFWLPFACAARRENVPSITNWLDTTGRVLEDQFRRRGLRSTRPPDMPLSTSPMDALIHPIRDAIYPRRYGFKNRERTNRLLLLMQLHANRHDNERTYAKNIREWLKVNGGRPHVGRRAIVNSRRVPSLR